MKKKFVHIGLLVDASRAYGRGICRGVADFAEAQKNWLIIPHERPEISKLTKTGVDGIIAYIPDEKLLNKVVSIGVPTINVHGYAGTGRVTTMAPNIRPLSGLPWISCNGPGFVIWRTAVIPASIFLMSVRKPS